MEEAQQPTPAADTLDGWTTPGPNGSTVLRLEDPIRAGESLEIGELVIAKPRAKHLRAQKSDDLDGLLVVLEAMSNQPRRVIDALSVPDMLRAVEVVQRGFPDGPSRGGRN